MDVIRLKEYILDNNRIEDVLSDIGCTQIKYHASSNYFTACNKYGDNPQAVVVYSNDNLNTIDYTRDIIQGDRATDLIDLVCYNKELSFPKALKYISNLCGLDYYHDFNEDIPESLQITALLKEMATGIDEEEDIPLKPISNHILDYYKPYVNDMFANDGITYETQQVFNIGYDEFTNRITIPIYSEIGDLVGVKGRLFKKELDPDDKKYMYIEPTPRNQVLYGLNITYNTIMRHRRVYVVEAEKGVMQGYSYGTTNIVATGGKKVSKQQIEILTRLGVEIIFAFDKDVQSEEILKIANRFPDKIPVYAICDKDNLMSDKESPTDDYEKWKLLMQNNIYKVR